MQLRLQIKSLQDELQRVVNARLTDPPQTPRIPISNVHPSLAQAHASPEYKPTAALQALLSQAEERMLRTSQFLAKTRAVHPSF